MRLRTLAFAVLLSLLAVQSAVTQTSDQPAQTVRVMRYSGSLPNAPEGDQPVTFSIYRDKESTDALWSETQTVNVSGAKFSVLLGSTTPDGLPVDLFSASDARWLAVTVNGVEQFPRELLVSVPYAMKAIETERLGGKAANEYVTATQLQQILMAAGIPTSSSAGTSGTPSTSTSAPTTTSASISQGSAQFIDTTPDYVVLVQQNGTGMALKVDSAGTVALQVNSTTTSGATTAFRATANSVDGIAAVFQNTANGKTVSFQDASGNERASVDNNGNIIAGQINATNFVGRGSGLLDIPNTATTATEQPAPGTIVARDQNGGFIAGQIVATNFIGRGSGLFDIPNSATTATEQPAPGTIVARDQNGGFIAGQIVATNFIGRGSGLFDIPNSATTATEQAGPGTIVARDQNGGFIAGQIVAANFIGRGSGLFDIPNSATTATEQAGPGTIVARDQNGGFIAGQIVATNFVGRGSGLFDIPNSATTATPQPAPGTIVARDVNGAFSASWVFANVVSAQALYGDGSNLTGVTAQNAQYATNAGNATTFDGHGTGDFAQTFDQQCLHWGQHLPRRA